jgi:hypothetical protein
MGINEVALLAAIFVFLVLLVPAGMWIVAVVRGRGRRGTGGRGRG